MDPTNARSSTRSADEADRLAARSYESLVPKGEFLDLPPIDSWRFDDALDVVALAQVDRCIGWRTWPEVWHLDDDGRFNCYYKGSSIDTLRAWADDPTPLHRSRREGLRSSGGCAARWMIVDSRPAWRRPPPVVDDLDVEAFVRLRREMASIGVTLLDAVVFDDCQHWWSLHEITAGTTSWTEAGIEPV